jgi:transcriptional regulator with XRE-family HTH domain
MKGDFEYFERIQKLRGVVTDYLNGLTREQIAKKNGLSPNTIGNYLRNKEALETIYGIETSEIMEKIKKRKAANIRSSAIMIDIKRIVLEEKGKSR